MNIKDSIALVTGANGGIGSALVDELMTRGAAKVYAAARRPETLNPLLEKYGSKLVPLALDVTDEASVAAAAGRTGDVTLLINNAGTTVDQGFISAKDLDGARREMAVNYFGPIRMIRAFAPLLATNGGGAVVNLLSFLSNVTIPLAGSYSASKAAALSMTRGVRAELAAQGTLVVAAMPAQVDTPLAANYPEPKATTAEVALETLDALEAGHEEVYPGTLAKEMMPMVLSDPKAVEKSLAGMLPT